MSHLKRLLLLLFFGSLWGVFEVAVGEVLFEYRVTHASAWLTAWAFLVLALARGVLNRPGSSTAIGTVAAVFRLANASPFFCHLLAIFILGFSFDILSTVLMKPERGISYRSSLSGVLSAYAGYVLFALTITYVVRYQPWVAGGSTKLLHYILESGSLAALMSIVVVPLGYWIGINVERIAERRPRWTYAGTVVFLIILWTLGKM